MATGLLALLDDVAAIAKMTSASLDDVAAQAAKAGAKAAGVVIDDAAVTPKYVVGLSPARELPIVWNIAKGSLKNKLIFLLPAALLLGWLAPWGITPLLACGGLFLCFEGVEKLHHMWHVWQHPPTDAQHAIIPAETITPEELERLRTTGAIRTDFILSAEIMAIAYATIDSTDIAIQAITLAAVAIGITAAVYGFVALVVKADDIGYHLAKEPHAKITKAFGRGIVYIMPPFLRLLGYVGTAAMLWVGGGIIAHSIPWLHHHMLHFVEKMQAEGILAWLLEACMSGILGVILGSVTVFIVTLFQHQRQKRHAR
jgi:uncharacterized protein